MEGRKQAGLYSGKQHEEMKEKLRVQGHFADVLNMKRNSAELHSQVCKGQQNTPYVIQVSPYRNTAHDEAMGRAAKKNYPALDQ